MSLFSFNVEYDDPCVCTVFVCISMYPSNIDTDYDAHRWLDKEMYGGDRKCAGVIEFHCFLRRLLWLDRGKYTERGVSPISCKGLPPRLVDAFRYLVENCEMEDMDHLSSCFITLQRVLYCLCQTVRTDPPPLLIEFQSECHTCLEGIARRGDTQYWRLKYVMEMGEEMEPISDLKRWDRCKRHLIQTAVAEQFPNLCSLLPFLADQCGVDMGDITVRDGPPLSVGSYCQGIEEDEGTIILSCQTAINFFHTWSQDRHMKMMKHTQLPHVLVDIIAEYLNLQPCR